MLIKSTDQIIFKKQKNNWSFLDNTFIFILFKCIDINQCSVNWQGFFRFNERMDKNNSFTFTTRLKKAKTYFTNIKVTLPVQVAICITLFLHVKKHLYIKNDIIIQTYLSSVYEILITKLKWMLFTVKSPQITIIEQKLLILIQILIHLSI